MFLKLVFDTAKAPFTKTSAGLIVGGGVFLGIGIVCGAVRHQQIKHGERHNALQLLKSPLEMRLNVAGAVGRIVGRLSM